MRKLLLYLSYLAIVAAIAGCGGHSSYSVDTGGSGSLRGVRTVPDDGEDNVEIGDTICVYWVEGYEPPPEFTFVLKDEYDSSVPTTKKAANDPNQWLFEPVDDLEYDMIYTIEVSAGGSGRAFTFRTEEDYRSVGMTGATESKKKSGPGGSEPQLEHTVKTGY